MDGKLHNALSTDASVCSMFCSLLWHCETKKEARGRLMRALLLSVAQLSYNQKWMCIN